MSREAYTIPTTSQSSSPSRQSPSSQSPSRKIEHNSPQQPAYERLQSENSGKVTYSCIACATKVTSKVTNRPGNRQRLQCDYCGGWSFYKIRTKAICQFEARWGWDGILLYCWDWATLYGSDEIRSALFQDMENTILYFKRSWDCRMVQWEHESFKTIDDRNDEGFLYFQSVIILCNFDNLSRLVLSWWIWENMFSSCLVVENSRRSRMSFVY